MTLYLCNICQTAFTRSDTLIAHQQTIKIEIHHLSVTGQDMMGYDELGWFKILKNICTYISILPLYIYIDTGEAHCNLEYYSTLKFICSLWIL